jgi:hypothetical protein
VQRLPLRLPAAVAMDLTPALERQRLDSDECREGTLAFVQRRAPVWPA